MRRTILVVDDEELNRELLRQMFESDRYNVITAQDGREAMLKLNTYADDIVIVLLDLMMPVVDGHQVLKAMNEEGILDKIPAVMITADTDQRTELSCYELGASAVINKPFVAQIVRKRVINLIENSQNKGRLEDILRYQSAKLSEQQAKLNEYYDNLLESIINIVEFRDLESGEHIQRVKGMTRIIAEAYMKLFPESGLTKEQMNVIVRASVVHDVGKIAVPDNVLLKPGRLTDEEREIMNSHTTKGCEILDKTNMVHDELFKASYEIVRHHHERHDGKGYPDKLKGDEIPLSARLVSIVDVYDALVSERVYKKPFDKPTAYQMIVDGKCGQFSPELLKCLEYARGQIEAFADGHK